MQSDREPVTLPEFVERWAAAQAARTDIDPRLEPPAYDDVEDEAERRRLQWAWRDGFTAALAYLQGPSGRQGERHAA